jgi:hypothetical protein
MAEYELKAGHLSEGDTYMKIIDLIDQLHTQCSILGHYKKENGDELIGQGFLAVGEMMKMTRITVTNLATGKMRREAGYR